MELNPFEQLNPAVIGAAITIAILTYFVLRRLFVLPYIEVMEARRERIDNALALREEARRIAEEATWEAAQITGEARTEIEQIRRDAQDAIIARRKEIIAGAVADVDKVLEGGRKEIQVRADVEADALRSQAVDCVTLACNRLIGSHDEVLVDSAVDRVLSRPE